MRYSVQRGSNPQGCEASRASARRSTLLAPKFYKIRRMADFLLRYSVQRGSNPQGNIPSSPPMEGNSARYGNVTSSPLRRGGARVSVPGWSNPHRPQFGQHTPVTRTHQCPPHHTGPRENAIFVGGYLWGRGVSSRAMTGGGVIRAPPCHCEGARNVENVVVRLWQSSYNMSAGIRPQCFFIYWIATLRSR